MQLFTVYLGKLLLTMKNKFNPKQETISKKKKQPKNQKNLHEGFIHI